MTRGSKWLAEASGTMVETWGDYMQRPRVYLETLMMLNLKDRAMRGFKFVVDDNGEKKAVVIDLDEHGELWEDFYDTWLASEREQEPRESLEVVRGKL